MHRKRENKQGARGTDGKRLLKALRGRLSKDGYRIMNLSALKRVRPFLAEGAKYERLHIAMRIY